jgi:phenylalanine-4-hydroxylase
MRTEYRIDDFQQVYFVVPSLQHLLDVTINTDFGPLYERLAAAADIAVDAVLPADRVLTRGTQAYAKRQAG